MLLQLLLQVLSQYHREEMIRTPRCLIIQYAEPEQMIRTPKCLIVQYAELGHIKQFGSCTHFEITTAELEQGNQFGSCTHFEITQQS